MGIGKKQFFPVHSIFGPTIQGEGASIGMSTVFVRFFGCDSYCMSCDSMYAVDKYHPNAHFERMDVDRILEQVQELCVSEPWTNREKYYSYSITFSGGNPALFPLKGLVKRLHGLGHDIIVETQGTVKQDWLKLVNVVSFSPKGPGMNDTKKGVMSPESVLDFVKFLWEPFKYTCPGCPQVYLKIVIFDEADLEYALEVLKHVRRYYDPDTLPMYLSVGNNKTGEKEGAIELGNELMVRYLEIFEELKGNPKYNQLFKDARLLPQWHTILWGNQMGV